MQIIRVIRAIRVQPQYSHDKIEHEFHELTECGWMPMRHIRVIRAIRVQPQYSRDKN